MILASGANLAWVLAQRAAPGGGGGGVSPVVIFGGIALVIIALVALGYWREGRRLKALADAAGRLGLSFTSARGRDLSPHMAFAGVAHLAELRKGATGVQWHARAENNSGLEVLEHMYTTGSGKSRREHRHTVVSAPCPRAWPALSLTPETLLTRLVEFFGGEMDIRLDDEDFNKRWRVKGRDEGFAVLALPPEVQAWLKSAPQKERWRIGEGRVCCIWEGRVDPSGLAALAARPAELMALMPPELAAWGPGARG